MESRIQDLDYLTKETGSERKEELGLRRGAKSEGKQRGEKIDNMARYE